MCAYLSGCPGGGVGCSDMVQYGPFSRSGLSVVTAIKHSPLRRGRAMIDSVVTGQGGPGGVGVMRPWYVLSFASMSCG